MALDSIPHNFKVNHSTYCWISMNWSNSWIKKICRKAKTDLTMIWLEFLQHRKEELSVEELRWHISHFQNQIRKFDSQTISHRDVNSGVHFRRNSSNCDGRFHHFKLYWRPEEWDINSGAITFTRITSANISSFAF